MCDKVTRILVSCFCPHNSLVRAVYMLLRGLPSSNKRVTHAGSSQSLRRPRSPNHPHLKPTRATLLTPLFSLPPDPPRTSFMSRTRGWTSTTTMPLPPRMSPRPIPQLQLMMSYTLGRSGAGTGLIAVTTLPPPTARRSSSSPSIRRTTSLSRSSSASSCFTG